MHPKQACWVLVLSFNYSSNIRSSGQRPCENRNKLRRARVQTGKDGGSLKPTSNIKALSTSVSQYRHMYGYTACYCRYSFIISTRFQSHLLNSLHASETSAAHSFPECNCPTAKFWHASAPSATRQNLLQHVSAFRNTSAPSATPPQPTYAT